jgi:hypothetical protein
MAGKYLWHLFGGLGDRGGSSDDWGVFVVVGK